VGNLDLDTWSSVVTKKWEAKSSASFLRRWGKSSHELGQTSGDGSCPDIWELDNGDIAIIGSDLTAAYETRLPNGVSVDPGERIVIIPRQTILAAKADIPDA
jgi:hypothetical protein